MAENYNGTLVLNTTDNCTAPTSIPDFVHPAVVYVQATVALIFSFIGISMNGFVVFLVIRYRALHKMAFFLALQLIVTHLVFSCTVPPVIFATALLREWRLGTVMCQILGSIHDLAITIRYLLTFVLTADRFVSVFCPFFYLQNGGKVAICNSVIMWIIAIVRVVTSLKGVLNCTQFVPTFNICSAAPFCSVDICRFHIFFFSTLLVSFGVIIPFALYVALFSKVMLIKYHIRRSLPRRQKHCQVAPLSNSNTDDLKVKPDLCINNKKELYKNTSSFGSQHNYRTTVTFVILTAVIVGCALPPYVLYVVSNVQSDNPSPIVTILLIIVGRTLIFSLAAVDPIIVMRNRDVQEVLKSHLPCRLKTFRSKLSNLRNRYHS